jgi:hypothetical protein
MRWKGRQSAGRVIDKPQFNFNAERQRYILALRHHFVTEGQVVDAAGQPIAGVDVALRPPFDSQPRPLRPATRAVTFELIPSLLMASILSLRTGRADPLETREG